MLVIQGKGEIPCVVGARQGGDRADAVTVEARSLTLLGDRVEAAAQGSAALRGTKVELEGEIYVNGQTLEEYIIALIMRILGGLG